MVGYNRADILASNPRALANAVADIEEIGKYALYGLGILAFFVWILLKRS